MLNKAKWLILLGFISGLNTFTELYSQNITKSPYSIIGVGDIVFAGNTANYTMGQVTQGRRGIYNINMLNPASYSGLLITNIEAGATYSQGHFKGTTQTNDVNTAWIAYLNFAVPIGNKGKQGISFGISPFSGLGYNIWTADSFQNDSPAYIYYQDYMNGRGGLSQFYFGYGLKVHRNISLGVNANYIFGQTKNTAQRLIPSQYFMFNTHEDKVNYIHGWTYDFGLQIHDTITLGKGAKAKDYEWVLGATITPESKLNVEQSYILRSLPIGSSSGIKDTVFENSSLTGTVTVPMSWKAGFSFGQIEKWQIAADLKGTQWSNYRSFGASDSLRNSFGFGLGGCYTPDYRSTKNLLKRVEYRAGFRYEQSNLSVNGTGVNVWALTAGFGIPLAKSRSKLNLGFEYMERGTTDNGLIQENYFRIIVGISFADKWFYRHRYD